MKQTGFFAATRIVLAKDLRLEWRTLETLSTSLVFSLIVIVIYSFAFGYGSVRELGAGRLLPGMIWTVVAFASVWLALVGGVDDGLRLRAQDPGEPTSPRADSRRALGRRSPRWRRGVPWRAGSRGRPAWRRTG